MSLICVLAGGCGSLTREVDQVSAETASQEIAVKSALIESAEVDAAAILVEYIDDVIVLSGFVGSTTESIEAERLATAAAGGKPVANRLRVR